MAHVSDALAGWDMATSRWQCAAQGTVSAAQTDGLCAFGTPTMLPNGYRVAHASCAIVGQHVLHCVSALANRTSLSRGVFSRSPLNINLCVFAISSLSLFVARRSSGYFFRRSLFPACSPSLSLSLSLLSFFTILVSQQCRHFYLQLSEPIRGASTKWFTENWSTIPQMISNVRARKGMVLSGGGRDACAINQMLVK
jgi:hypothetical protein